MFADSFNTTAILESIDHFLLSWLVHYFAVLMLIGLSYVFISTKAKNFLAEENKNRQITVEDVTVYVSIILLIGSILILFIAHWIPFESYEMYE